MIALASTALTVFHSVGHTRAVPMPMALFGVQISGTLATVCVVGLLNPMVTTNDLVIVVQIVAVLVALRVTSLAP
ncbi:MAG: hypothetical protein ABJX32_16270 [Tateyamaria sp.]|uniref:hypothetical protein n=1 Tax=Tateyamaria sp. TaxID=1929288 RepID=UPI00329CCE0D